MKKRFTFLIAAVMLLMMTSLPERAWGQAPVNTVLWAEDFSGYSANDVPSGSITDSHAGTTVYGEVTLTYSCTDGGGTTKIYNENIGGGSAPEILIAKSSGTFSISGISTGEATEMTLTYMSNKSTLSISSSTTGITITKNTSKAGSEYSYNVSNSESVSTFNLTFTAYENSRVDNIVLKVKTAGTPATAHRFYTAVLPANSGTVVAKDSGNNTISSGSDVAEEAMLTVTATAETGYKFSHWSLPDGSDSDVDDVNASPTSFMMGTDDVTLTANFATAYTVTCATSLSNGSISADMGTAVVGETVTITATPDAGYDLDAITVTKNGGGTIAAGEITYVGNTAAFEMPADNVTVSATFKAKTTYTITRSVTPANSGTITADNTAWEGKMVNVSVSPAAGYVYKEIAITKTGDPGTTVSYTGNASDGFSFTMPAYAVTVTVTFRTAEIYALYSGTITEGDYVIYYSGKAIKNTVSSNRLDYIEVTPVSDQIVDPAASIVWHISQSGDYWKIYNANVEKYMASNGTDKQAALDTGNDTKSSWIVTGTSTYEFENVYKTNNYKYLRNNTTYGFACYQSSTGGALSLYKKTVNSTLAVAPVANGTITATPAGGSAIAMGESLSVSSGTTITLSAEVEGSYVLDAWDVYKTGDESTQVTVENNTFTMPEYNVTVRASFRLPTTFTVQYSVNGAIVSGLTQSGIAEGNSVTLHTTGFTVPTGFDYAGWTENEVSAELIGTATYTPTDNTTLYLVFVKSGQTAGYNKVTSLDDITPGTYIIVNDNHCLPSGTTTSSPVKTEDYAVTNASSTSNYTSVPNNTEWLFTGTKTAMTIKNSDGSYLYSQNNTTGIRVSSTSDTWAFETNSTAPCFAMKEAANSRYCATYKGGEDWRSYTSKDHDNYGGGGVLYLYKKTQVYTRVYDATTTTMANIPATSIVTVPNGVTLTLTGTNQGNETNLIIEDGGQLICNNSVQATAKKSIIKANNWGTGSSDDGWYFIASPVNDDVSPATCDLITDSDNSNPTYDLYYLDGANNLWKNYRNEGFSMSNGQGYLYASKNGNDKVAFAGAIQPSSEKEVDGLVAGKFNLVGNPYTCNAYVNQPYFTLSQVKDGVSNTTTATVQTTPILPCTGVVVKPEGASVTFTPVTEEEEELSSGMGNVEMVLAQNVTTRGESTTQTLDNAIVSFNEGNQLGKFYFGTQDANLYIPMDNEEYAIVSSSAQGEMPINFKAHRDGQYTITVNPQEVEMGYLHLIDNIGGTDIDLLATPSYTFNAKADDYESRFRLVFSANMVNADLNDDFAFFSNGQLVIANEGESLLQVIDVNGRIVMTESVNGTCSKAINVKAGVYVLRLIQGTDVKTQKIIVK